MRDLFGAGWSELYDSAIEVPPGADGVTFVPYLVHERTTRREASTGASWSGIAIGHRRPHLLKAVLEGVAFALRQAMEALEANGVSIPELRLAGGGTMNASWRQMLADVLGKPLLAAVSPAGAARGAALLAGLAAETYAAPAELAALAPLHQLAAEPSTQSDMYSALYQQWLDRSAERSL